MKWARKGYADPVPGSLVVSHSRVAVELVVGVIELSNRVIVTYFSTIQGEQKIKIIDYEPGAFPFMTPTVLAPPMRSSHGRQ